MTTCPSCGHPTVEHSSEPGVGSLHRGWMVPGQFDYAASLVTCPCTEPGTSKADQ